MLYLISCTPGFFSTQAKNCRQIGFLIDGVSCFAQAENISFDPSSLSYTKGNLHLVWGLGPLLLVSHAPKLSAPQPDTYPNWGLSLNPRLGGTQMGWIPSWTNLTSLRNSTIPISGVRPVVLWLGCSLGGNLDFKQKSHDNNLLKIYFFFKVIYL